MWIKPSDRRELIELASASRRLSVDAIDASDRYSMRAASGAELILGWDADPRRDATFPTLIAVQESAQPEFFAWTATFLEYFRPLSAYCRVIDPHILTRESETSDRPVGLGRLRCPLVGLILGEVLTEADARTDLRSMFPVACFSTFWFAAAQALAAHLPTSDALSLTSRWTRSLRLGIQRRRRLTSSMLEELWKILYHAAVEGEAPSYRVHSDEIVALFVRDMVGEGELDGRIWDALTEGSPELFSIWKQMGLSREERLVGCEKALDLLRQLGGMPTASRNLIAGYLVSRISPGTLDHVSLLKPHSADLPTAILWYGFCAGCQGGGEILNCANGLGRRVLRDIEHSEPLAARPSSDIALPELEVLNNDGGPGVPFRQERSGHLKIELLPRVYVHLRTTDADYDEHRVSPRDSAELAAQLDEVVWKMYELRRRLVPGAPPPREQEKPTRRGRRKNY